MEERRLLSVSLWDASTVPFNKVVQNDPAAEQGVELGVRFQSDASGYITGLRYYKGVENAGTHVGHLWTATGTLLGSVTFTNESSEGWQEVSFASPIHIDAGTAYIASYYAPVGHYAVDEGYFNGRGVDSGPLHALPSGTGQLNGVYAVGTQPPVNFPTSWFNANNYWVDVLYDANLVPQVQETSPATHATYVSPDANPSVTFSVPMDAASINASSILLRGPGNVLVGGTVSYDAAHRRATIDPAASLNENATYTLVIKGGAGGVKSTDGSALAGGDFSSNFRVQPIAPNTIFPASAFPQEASHPDFGSVEVGVRFSTDTAGVITGVRFYKGTGNVGTHVGSLWTSDGQLLARATFTDETDSGWQQVTFDDPVVVPAGTSLIASYFAPRGHYALTPKAFVGDVNTSPLHPLRDGAEGGNGLFRYSPTPPDDFVETTSPPSSFESSNYWVDVVFFQGPLQSPNSPPIATPQTVDVKEDDRAVINLAAEDAESPVSDLTFRIETLPARGVLKFNGVAVTAGQTFNGPPANLTYEPGAETEGGTADAFTFSVVDPEGLASDAATVSINVNKAVADGAVVLTGGILRIGGTAGNDLITVSRTPAGKYRVTMGLKVVSDTIPVAGVSEIRIWGRGGNDGLAVIDGNTRTMISGGDGTDVIAGGNGDDLILGGNGDDALSGFGGNDVIVGGDGRDALLGMDGHDILAAGGVSANISIAGLRQLGLDWVANKPLTPLAEEATDALVTDDDLDLLTGGGGSDWFILSLGDRVLDYSNRVGNKDVITYVS